VSRDCFVIIIPRNDRWDCFVVGFFSGWYQGKTAAAAIGLVARNPEEVGKATVMVAMVETYAVFSLLASLLLFNGINL